jgi:cytochrome c oxidase subunit 2/cytochrome aa3-600 menaquinol oxidase subunit 2
VDVELTSLDVIHSFWVPRLAGKLDAIPGRTNVLRLQADAPGEYAGVSAEYSGTGYLGHRFTVRALDTDDWRAFLAGGAP